MKVVTFHEAGNTRQDTMSYPPVDMADQKDAALYSYTSLYGNDQSGSAGQP